MTVDAGQGQNGEFEAAFSWGANGPSFVQKRRKGRGFENGAGPRANSRPPRGAVPVRATPSATRLPPRAEGPEEGAPAPGDSGKKKTIASDCSGGNLQSKIAEAGPETRAEGRMPVAQNRPTNIPLQVKNGSGF